MARNRKQEECKAGAPDWLTTYSDMVTLLLCFFVLLFTFSSVDAEKFRSIMASFQGGTGVLSGGSSLDIPINPIEDDLDVDEVLNELLAYLEDFSESLDLGEGIEVISEERGIVIRFTDNVFFDSGSADLKPDSLEVLKSVAEILNEDSFKDKQIKIEGHTDSDPILRKSPYPTNWELSTARATNVLRYFEENGYIQGERISSSGYSFYRPIAPNDTRENKARNRRVDIVILRDLYIDLEP